MEGRLAWLRQRLGEVLGGPLDDQMFTEVAEVVEEYTDQLIEDRESRLDREYGLRGERS